MRESTGFRMLDDADSTESVGQHHGIGATDTPSCAGSARRLS